MAQDQLNDMELLVIGGSSGSLGVVLGILMALPADFPIPIILVIHRGNSQESLLHEVLGLKSNLPLRELEEKEVIRPCMVYLAPADYHVLIEKDKSFSLDYSEKMHYSRPSIDVTFISAAEVYRDRMMGILLSGANEDGAEGMREIKTHGGYCLIQDPDDAVMNYMPRHALELTQADAVLSGSSIINFLLSLPVH
jgi:two-component system chemotaxis response regulator CheB